MDWFFNWLGKKIRRADQDVKLSRAVISANHIGSTAVPSTRRVEMIKAINGNLIEVWTRPSAQHDWKSEVYIVKDDESVADAIATVLVVTGGV